MSTPKLTVGGIEYEVVFSLWVYAEAEERGVTVSGIEDTSKAIRTLRTLLCIATEDQRNAAEPALSEKDFCKQITQETLKEAFELFSSSFDQAPLEQS